MRKRKISTCILILAIAVIVAITLLPYSCQSKPGSMEQNSVQNELAEDSIGHVQDKTTEAVSTANLLNYELISKEDISYSNVSRMVHRIVLNVESIPSEEDIRRTVNNIWQSENKSWNEFTVFGYLPEMNTDYAAYVVCEFKPSGLDMFHINEHSVYDTKWEKVEEPIAPKPLSSAQLTEYTIELEAQADDDRNVTINISTNFPDGSNLLVDVGRVHYLKGEDDRYSGSIYSQDLKVDQGQIGTTVLVDDSEWYKEHLRLVKALPDDIMPIESISENITISVLFSPARSQPKQVLAVVGELGESISGAGSSILGKLTTFRVSKELNIPFQE